jgi:biopolymer transport protein ExbB
MQQITQLNSLEFITQGGVVTITVALILLAMSVASWYFIVVKTIQTSKNSKQIKNDIHTFWMAPTLETVLDKLQHATPTGQLAAFALDSSVHYKTYQSAADGCNYEEFIARSMRRSLSLQQAKLESGLSVLASVGSVSPFVGLFGTVWGIYHALASISAGGQATLDKVAGPVGEALIMTAIGLAVAIPAVLAYNAFLKSNRNMMAKLENYAQDLHTLLTTGAPLLMAKDQVATDLSTANTVQGAPLYAR